MARSKAIAQGGEDTFETLVASSLGIINDALFKLGFFGGEELFEESLEAMKKSLEEASRASALATDEVSPTLRLWFKNVHHFHMWSMYCGTAPMLNIPWKVCQYGATEAGVTEFIKFYDQKVSGPPFRATWHADSFLQGMFLPALVLSFGEVGDSTLGLWVKKTAAGFESFSLPSSKKYFGKVAPFTQPSLLDIDPS